MKIGSKNLIVCVMKKYSILCAFLMSFLFSSCLKDGLEEGEFSSECDVTDVKFEHRWADEMDTPGMAKLLFKEMQVKKTIDKENCIVEVIITVPKADGNYPVEQREVTALSNLACSFFVSRAASVKPLNGAPKLGTMGDYSTDCTYRVISASGKYKDWTLKVVDFVK